MRALAYDPRLLPLDEVPSALDPELVGEVLRIVRDLAEQGMTILMATHEMGFARQVAHRVCFLDGGVVLEEGPPSRCSPTRWNPAPGSSCHGSSMPDGSERGTRSRYLRTHRSVLPISGSEVSISCSGWTGIGIRTGHNELLAYPDSEGPPPPHRR